jgi:hypothetical protein
VIREFSLLILAGMIASCAASLPYRTDYPLTSTVVHSRDGILSANVPQGWFSSTEDTLGTALSIFLMNDDVSATLTVKELKLDRLSAQEVEKHGLKLLARMSAGFQSAESPVEPREFELREKKFCSYEIEKGGTKNRIVVFSARQKYYECEARAVRVSLSGDQYASMFTVQQTFLLSLSY